MSAKYKDTFTPGPWVSHSGAVYKDGPNVYPKGPDNGIRIALMDRDTPQTTPVERDQNARLIATAPELLAALQAMLKAYAPNADFTNPGELHSAVLAAGTAIAKATKY